MRRSLFALAVLCLITPVSARAQTMAPPAAVWLEPAPHLIEGVMENGRLTFRSGVDAALLQATLVNPQGVEFPASTDQGVIQNTVQILTSYALEVYPAANTSGTPTKTASLGLPTPAATTNLITLPTALKPLLDQVAPGDYAVKIASVGPGGTSRTPASVPFTVAVRAPSAAGTPVPK